MPVSPKRMKSEAVDVTPLTSRIVAMPRLHTNEYPLWAGPSGAGPLGGITQSMLVRFLSCRERFRLKYVLGLEPHDKWNHRIGYGNMWHACEEAFAADRRGLCGEWQAKLEEHSLQQCMRYPMQVNEINKWFCVCRVQFPEYVAHWQHHPDVQSRLPLMQEEVFDVPYELPSGRIVRLRGKFDSVDLIDDAVYLQENKSKGDVDKQRIERQLKFDLQTMLYLIALRSQSVMSTIYERLAQMDRSAAPITVNGVRYNVVRRPLSGGKGSIKQGEATRGSKCGKCKGEGKWMPRKGPHIGQTMTCDKCEGRGRTGAKPAESDEEFYGRVRDVIKDDLDYWFFRVRSEVGDRDIEVFQRTCLDPLLETLCWWYDDITCPCKITTGMFKPGTSIPMNYRTPFGVYSALEDDGATEYDMYLETGNEAGLRRTETLFPELQT